MKKSLIAILIVALMLFASCDSQILEIMEKMGQNLVPETPEVTVTVGDEKPEVTEDGILNKVGGLLGGSSDPVSMVGGLTDEDKANIIELAGKNPEAIEEMKTKPATEEQKEAAGAVAATANVIVGVLDAVGVNPEVIQESEFPEELKSILSGVVEAVNKAAENAESDELTQADVIGMQIISGLVNDVVETAIESIPEGGVTVEGIEDNITKDNIVDKIVEERAAGGDGTRILGAVVGENIESVIISSVENVSTSVDLMNIMGMTGGVDANSLISGLRGSL